MYHFAIPLIARVVPHAKGIGSTVADDSPDIGLATHACERLTA
jgi:hypothetical protein